MDGCYPGANRPVSTPVPSQEWAIRASYAALRNDLGARCRLLPRDWWERGFWPNALRLWTEWSAVDDERRDAEVRAGLTRSCEEAEQAVRAAADSRRRRQETAAVELAHEQELHELRAIEDAERERRIADESWALQGLKSDASLMRIVLAGHGVAYAFHWTESSNLESILTSGLLSRAHQAEQGIRARWHSYGSEYRQERLREYVGFSLRPQWGMLKDAVDPVLIQVGAAIVARRGAAFSVRNTANRDVDIDEVLRQTTTDALERLFEPNGRLVDWVPSPVERWRLRRLVFEDDRSRDRVVSSLPPALARSDAVARATADERYFAPGSGPVGLDLPSMQPGDRSLPF
jgi:hypothetical protein